MLARYYRLILTSMRQVLFRVLSVGFYETGTFKNIGTMFTRFKVNEMKILRVGSKHYWKLLSLTTFPHRKRYVNEIIEIIESR